MYTGKNHLHRPLAPHTTSPPKKKEKKEKKKKGGRVPMAQILKTKNLLDLLYFFDWILLTS
jgi:hypothetical protein